ncbi:MAG: nitroreductase family protein [Anaerolineae bacterium]|nr:nitroreductase family protein [Anaerolineae bacterium]
MTHPIPVPNILARRSIRKFTDQPVTPEQIDTLLRAAMAAPSARNDKPWHFVYVTERAMLDRLVAVHQNAKMLHQATLCICVCGEPGASEYWEQDCSAATENILLAATGLGLGGVWLGVHPKPDREANVREALGIPESITPLNLIAIGHPAEAKEARTQYDAGRVHAGKW